MGGYFSKLKFHSVQLRESNRSLSLNEERKRKRESESDSDTNDAHDQIPSPINTPTRKRLKSTSKYIYQTLFLDGEKSDVTIVALGRSWPLHKLYLCQSPYFASMFSGSWKESGRSEIKMDVVDDNIDENVLRIVFGSLYKDDVFLKPINAVGVLAAATLLQLDNLIQHCVSLMIDNISSSTLCAYFYAAQTYGISGLLEECLSWILINLLTSQDTKLLMDISVDMMKMLVASPDLFVMQMEMDVYSVLKKWMFLALHSNWSGSHKDLCSESEQFFRNSAEVEHKYFLQLEEGRQFITVFENLRWQYIINNMASLNILEKDKIIDMKWIEPVFQYQWRQMLQIGEKQNEEHENIDENLFMQQSNRCGRVIRKEGKYCWRWVGYSYGLDLLVIVMNRTISLKRNITSHTSPHLVDIQPRRTLYYRLLLASLDANGKKSFEKSTEIKKEVLERDSEVIVLYLDTKMKFPVYLSMNILLTSPVDKIPKLTFPSPSNSHVADDIKSTVTEEPSTISHSDTNLFESPDY